MTTSETEPSSVPQLEFDLRSNPDLWSDPWGSWDPLREAHPFFLASGGPDRIWVATRYDAIHEALQHPELFSSRSVTPYEAVDAHRWIPEELDPPEHTAYRQLLTPFFTPGKVKEMTPRIRSWCVELIDGFAGDGHCELIGQFARRYPTYIFMGIMGLPEQEADMLLDWADRLLHTSGADDPDGSIRGGAAVTISEYLTSLIAARRAEPRDDLVTFLTQAEIDGAPIPEQELLEACFLLYMGGLDTVAGELGCFFRHLAEHPEHRAQLVSEPALVPAAVEEMLRYYSIVMTGRVVTTDVEFHGCPMRAGDRLQMPLASAGRDQREFPGESEVDFQREINRHMAFGAGPHRCLGSHLARAELAIALEEWHTRIPSYRLADPDTIRVHAGGVAGYDRLDLVWP
jgi:cytochrome P450